MPCFQSERTKSKVVWYLAVCYLPYLEVCYLFNFLLTLRYGNERLKTNPRG